MNSVIKQALAGHVSLVMEIGVFRETAYLSWIIGVKQLVTLYIMPSLSNCNMRWSTLYCAVHRILSHLHRRTTSGAVF